MYSPSSTVGNYLATRKFPRNYQEAKNTWHPYPISMLGHEKGGTTRRAPSSLTRRSLDYLPLARMAGR